MTPFYAPLLPGPVKARVAALALVSPEARTGGEFVIGGWFGREAGAANPGLRNWGRETGADDVVAAIDRAAPLAPVSLFEEDGEGSACPAAGAPSHGFAGGHHLGEDYDRIAQVLPDLARRTRARS